MSTLVRRRLGIALYCLCLGVLFTTGFLALYGQRWLQRGIAYGPSPDIPLAAVYPYGVNADLTQYPARERDALLDRLRRDGFGWIRQPVSWATVEPRRGQYDWAAWDAIVEATARYNLRLLLVIERTPVWGRAPDEPDPRALPAAPADLAEFVGAVAGRYAGRVTALEIWRDPNLAPWHAPLPPPAAGPDPGAYTTYLKAAYAAAKTADPAIVVLNAGLAPTTESSARAVPDPDFLEAMYDAGAAPYFDALAARPLGFWSGPEDRRVAGGALNFSRLLLLRDIMVRHGDAGKAVWAVEFGWNALPAGWTGAPSPWGTDAPVRQAERTVGAVRRAQREWPWVGPLLALHLDPAAPADDPVQGFALLGDDLTPRPTYRALRDYIAADLVGVGRYPADAWFVGTDWQPVDGAQVVRTADAIVVRRPATSGLYYVVLGLILAAAGVVAWRLDRLLPLPRWELALVVVAAIFLASPWLTITILALGVLFILFALRLDLALALIVALIPFFRVPKYFGPQPISVVELFTWLAFAAWLARTVISYQSSVIGNQTTPDTATTLNSSHFTRYSLLVTRYASRFTSLDYALLALILISLLSPLIAANTGVAIRELRVVVIDSALFYWLVRSAGLERRGLWRLVDALVVAGLLLALYGFYQYFISGDVIVAEGVRRMRSIYPSPNNLSLFLGRIVPLAGVLAVWGSERWRRVFYALAGLLMVAALFLTFSRAAWLVGLPLTALFVGLVRGRRAIAVALAAVIAIGLSVLPFAGTARIRSLFQLAPGSSTYRRLKLWQATLDMIRDHPIFGVGLDNFLYQYREHYILPGALDDPNLSHPHNVVLDFWARLGILGVAAFVWIEAAFFRVAWHIYTRGATEDRALALGLMAAMVYVLAHGLLDQSFFLVDLAYVFMLVVGVVRRLQALNT
jgi:O-antigen ligase